MIVVEFVIFFLIVLVLGYLLPAGRYYYWYYVRATPAKEERRIQQRRPTRKQIQREVRLSLQTVLIWAVMATLLFQCYKSGATRVYLHFRDYPLWYLPLSVFLCFVVHDTYFYWTHRFMHWPPVFKYFHLAHHRSIAPTPWAIYAFEPLEAVMQFLGIYLIVFLLPLHPLSLLAFLAYDTEVNTAGHTGYEVLPRWLAQSSLYRGLNTVRHHDAHHTNPNVNFGSFFNVWDRWMGTFFDAQEPWNEPATARPALAAPLPPVAAKTSRPRNAWSTLWRSRSARA